MLKSPLFAGKITVWRMHNRCKSFVRHNRYRASHLPVVDFTDLWLACLTRTDMSIAQSKIGSITDFLPLLSNL
jgi:hypothetical protein